MEGQGMEFNKSYFDGKTGANYNMQTGSEDLTSEEIAAKMMVTGLIPEMNYSTSGMKYEVTGIEKFDGKECYVIKLEDGMSESYDYFDKTTFMKIGSLSIETSDGETQEVLKSYGDFVASEEILFPTTYTLSVGDVVFNGKLVKRELNANVNLDDFK